jgi:pyruvate,water dikinase
MIAPPDTDVLWLDDARATDPRVAGAKAAALARARAAAFPIVPGFVMTVGAETDKPAFFERPDVRAAWAAVSNDGTARVIVRSSSTVEDGDVTSMAGVFESIAGVKDWTTFRAAVERVRRSANGAPMAVLVQSELEATRGGIAFGFDPVSGRRDRVVVAAIDGTPGPLVSGQADGTRYTLTHTGRALRRDGDRAGSLTWRQRRRLATLSSRAATLFGAAQDIEWAFDLADELWMLQSRPITAAAGSPDARGPLLGPGPIAETFPEALAPLEQDLWIDPMRAAIREAMSLVRVASKRRIQRSPVIEIVDGRAAVDLGLLGLAPRRSIFARIDPRAPVRRLLASWRVGRLRAALPALATDLLEQIDSELDAVPALKTLDEATLLGILHSSRRRLIALHGHEVLIGLLISNTASARTAAGVALRSVAAGRHRGENDAEIIAGDPTVLALIAPRIAAETELPPTPASAPELPHDVDPLAQAREDLRARARWVQELTARAAYELGRRLARARVFATPELIRWTRLHELPEIVKGEVVPLALEDRIPSDEPAPLPTAFRLTEGGDIVPEDSNGPRDGQGAGGGRATGTVAEPNEEPHRGDVLVVRHLDPKLASLLPELGGLVAETGSVLSHLAILAREYGIPTVVGVRDAVDRFPPGTTVLVDGTAGEVVILDEGGAA